MKRTYISCTFPSVGKEDALQSYPTAPRYILDNPHLYDMK